MLGWRASLALGRAAIVFDGKALQVQPNARMNAAARSIAKFIGVLPLVHLIKRMDDSLPDLSSRHSSDRAFENLAKIPQSWGK